MNPVEIEEAVSQLAQAAFDPQNFPFAFLEAFGNKQTTIDRLKSTGSGSTNQSDLTGGVLQRNNIHLLVCQAGQVDAGIEQLRNSKLNQRHKVKYLLATDGLNLVAENILNGEVLACEYPKLADHFGFFLPLAGITTVKQISENAFDVKATGRLNRLYLELLRTNPEWATSSRREELNQFIARLIFCFFAEDTQIFPGVMLFSDTVNRMSASDASNTHEVIGELFRAMSTPIEDRSAVGIANWAKPFPYVNGGLFKDTIEIPRFNKIALSYLRTIGTLDWTKVNPDIFGSMIQAIASDDERGNLGMHYTSVPNILKVLNPLFLDGLREQLAEAGNNPRKLLNLRQRLARIRVFDPACGSGNFLVIAYKQLRAIEAELNQRRNEPELPSVIPLTNFRGIELSHFASEIARLALIIAEYQCDLQYRGKQLALAEFLPLKADNWIVCGNALRLDWLSICPPTGTQVQIVAQDMFSTPPDQAEIAFENEGGETYICGNPPYLGSSLQTAEQKQDLELVFAGRAKQYKSLDYVAGWFIKAADYGIHTRAATALVATNSICQGQQVPILWPLIAQTSHHIHFAYTSFKWANLASHNAGVTVVIVGITNQPSTTRQLFVSDLQGEVLVKTTNNINAYLIAGPNIIVNKSNYPISDLTLMDYGSKPTDGGNLLLSLQDLQQMNITEEQRKRFIKPFLGSAEFIKGIQRYCLWIADEDLQEAMSIPTIARRIEAVQAMRLASTKAATREGAKHPHRFDEKRQDGTETVLIVPSVSSENREYLPIGSLQIGSIVSNSALAIYNAPLWNMALIASRLHLVWIGTVCGKLKTDFRYSNTMGWNTFPVPTLTEQNKLDLTRTAEEILLAREHYFPATIADMYDPERMDQEFPLLRAAHQRNDELIERIYIGRRFKNDTERLEKLFDLYSKQIANTSKPAKKAKK
jgi:hypothetical protein